MLDVAAVHTQVAAIQVLQPDDRGALVQRLLEQRTYRLDVRRVAQGGDREHGRAPAESVDCRDKVRFETVEQHRQVVSLARGDQLDLVWARGQRTVASVEPVHEGSGRTLDRPDPTQHGDRRRHLLTDCDIGLRSGPARDTHTGQIGAWHREPRSPAPEVDERSVGVVLRARLETRRERSWRTRVPLRAPWRRPRWHES